MKPREFWVCYDDDKDRGDDWFTDNLKNITAYGKKHAIHVIEYSAYETLKNETVCIEEYRNEYKLRTVLKEEISRLTEQSKILQGSLDVLTEAYSVAFKDRMEIINELMEKLKIMREALEQISKNSPMVLTSYPPKDYAAYTANKALEKIK